ncbi:MBL fold metallo-hydrolase [Pseudomonas sp. NFXW11]|uniref:MBL fold metallo-hydrolase n=1 Tax=Pseudomonas sp. NFXW11 TaxID=2819531 RepID=UPI003CEDB871
MSSDPRQSPNQLPPIALERLDFGRVAIFFGARNGKYPDGNQILIRGTDTRAALDTPLVANHIGPLFDSSELVVLGHAHEDHMAGLHRVPQAKVYVHQADLAAARSWQGLQASFGIADKDRAAQMLDKLQREFFYTPRPDALGYEDGACWELGGSSIRALHLPGHTAGHTALLVEPEGVLFIGDIDLTGFGPYYADASSSLGDFRRSLERLAQIPARVWVTSHHRGVYTDRQRFLDHLAIFAGKIDEREQRLLNWLQDQPLNLAQLVQRRLLYPQGFSGPWVEDAETRTLNQHLDELLAQGRVHLDEQGLFHC